MKNSEKGIKGALVYKGESGRAVLSLHSHSFPRFTVARSRACAMAKITAQGTSRRRWLLSHICRAMGDRPGKPVCRRARVPRMGTLGKPSSILYRFTEEFTGFLIHTVTQVTFIKNFTARLRLEIRRMIIEQNPRDGASSLLKPI